MNLNSARIKAAAYTGKPDEECSVYICAKIAMVDGSYCVDPHGFTLSDFYDSGAVEFWENGKFGSVIV